MRPCRFRGEFFVLRTEEVLIENFPSGHNFSVERNACCLGTKNNRGRGTFYYSGTQGGNAEAV